MIAMPKLAEVSPAGCQCYSGPRARFCVCSAAEKTLRHYVDGAMTVPMTAEQREECLAEIEQVEGYRRDEWENRPDGELAAGVLQAWTDYWRDKGML